MSSVSRSREIAASAEEIWKFASDPRNLPKWWPRTASVEAVTGRKGRGQRWGQVYVTKKGSEVVAPQRCTYAKAERQWSFEQEVSGTPFERVLKAARVDLFLESLGDETLVTLRVERQMRGLSVLGSAFVRRAGARTVSEALEALEGRLRRASSP